MDGAVDDATEGEVLDEPDGPALGELEGDVEFEGADDGNSDGAKEGLALGTFEGTADCAAAELELGKAERLRLVAGEYDGTALGDDDGAEDGVPDGTVCGTVGEAEADGAEEAGVLGTDDGAVDGAADVSELGRVLGTAESSGLFVGDTDGAADCVAVVLVLAFDVDGLTLTVGPPEGADDGDCDKLALGDGVSAAKVGVVVGEEGILSNVGVEVLVG